MKKLGLYTGWAALMAGLMLGVSLVAFPASVTELAGLAVAQTAQKWNVLKDMAVGDANTSGSGLFTPCLWNGASCDRQRGTIAGGADVAIKSVTGGGTPADAFANPTNALTAFGLNGVFNGTTWDRARTGTADNLASTGLQADIPMVFNNVGFDRPRSASAGNNTATTSTGIALNAVASTWRERDTDVGATQSTASKAAGGGTVRHVATSVTLCRGDSAVATPALVHLRDGATGAGTIIRSWVIGISVANESKCENLSGLNETGSANTAMTLEFAAAGSATSTSTVTLSGYSTP